MTVTVQPLIPLPRDVRALLDAPNYVHLATLRADGSPRSHVVWVGVEGDRVLVCTSDTTWKARDMRRDPRVSFSVVDSANPYRMAGLQGRVLEERADHDCRYMDPISVKYTGEPFPSRGADRICFVIGVEKAAARTLGFHHRPGQGSVRRTHPMTASSAPSRNGDEMPWTTSERT